MPSAPLEILGRILLVVAEESESSFVRWLKYGTTGTTTKPPKAPPYAWIHLTHVCQAWRTLALQTSLLWSFIVVKDEDETFEMIQRAGSRPLTLAVSSPRNITDYTWSHLNTPEICCLRKILPSHLHRIQTLIIPRWDAGITMVSAPTSPVRRLILVTSHAEVPQDLLWRRSWVIPQLEELNTGHPLGNSLASMSCANLRTLVLLSTDLMSLVAALRKATLLETLDVGLAEPSLSSAAPISLPRLRSLRLNGAIRLCAALFRLLELPRDARIAMSPPGFEGPMSSVPMVLGSMPRILHQLTAPALDAPAGAAPFAPALSLEVVFGYESCRLRGWRRAHALGEWWVLADNQPDVLLGLVRHTFAEDAAALLSTLPLHGLQVLRIHWLPHADMLLPYMKRLSTCASLQVLVLDDVSMEVVSELAAVTTAQEVWLMGIDFEGVREVALPYLPSQADSSDRWLALVETCAIRAASDQAFARIYVEGGREVNEFVVAMLRESPGTQVEFLEQRPPGASRRW